MRGDDASEHSLTRRALLTGACALPLVGARASEINPFDLSLLQDGPTPNELFFVREHFPAPTISTHGFSLKIEGAAEAPFALNLDELYQSPKKSLAATIECADNPVGGGLVSHASWEGIALAELLRKAKMRPEARFVRLAGADGFERYLPVAKALDGDTLVVLRMNGQNLPTAHGGPLRALVPGWYGSDSVKWLQKIEVLESGPRQEPYSRASRSLLTGQLVTERITGVQVKSVFSRPQNGAILFGRHFVLRGAAWSGEDAIKSVEVSTDGGNAWLPATLQSASKYCWAHWQCEWKISGPGDYELVVRATNDKDIAQPLFRPSGRADEFEQNSCQRITVKVA